LTVLVPGETVQQVKWRLDQALRAETEVEPHHRSGEEVKLEAAGQEDHSQSSDDPLEPEEEDEENEYLPLQKCSRKNTQTPHHGKDRKTKSPVWRYFMKCPKVPDVCICLACDAKVKSNKGTTTNMMNHLRRHHDWQPEDDSVSNTTEDTGVRQNFRHLHCECISVIKNNFKTRSPSPPPIRPPI
jgi:hypothetical protein